MTHENEIAADPSSGKSGLKTDSLATGLSILLILTIGQRFIGFGRNLLFCRWLEPSELGRWNLAFSLLMLAAPLVVLGLPGSFGRYVEHYRHRGQLKSFLRRTSALTIFLGLLGVTGLAFFHRSTAWFFFGDSQLSTLLFASVTCLLSVITFNFLIELFTAMRQLKVVSYMQVANSLLFAAVSLALIAWWKQAAISIIIGYGVACCVTAVASVGALRRGLNSFEDTGEPLQSNNLWRKILPFAAWIWFGDLMLNLFQAADRYMIVHFAQMTNEESAGLIGQYHSSLIIPTLVLAIAYMVASVIMPYLTNNWENGKFDSVVRYVNATLQLYGFGAYCVGVGVLLFSPLIFGWALQGKYTDGLSVLPWTLAFSIWAGLMAISTCHMRCAERAGIATIGPMIGVLLNVALNLILLPRLGLLGAVLATAAGNLFSLLINVYFCTRCGFKTERGTVWITVLPFCLALGLPIAVLAGCITMWAIVRTEWVCSNENKSDVLEQLANRLPARFAHFSTSPIFGLPAASTMSAQ